MDNRNVLSDLSSELASTLSEGNSDSVVLDDPGVTIDVEPDDIVNTDGQPQEVAVNEEEDTPVIEDVDSGDIKTIAQLAKAIEVEPGYLYDIEIGMGGDNDPIKIGEIKDKYQNSLHQTAKLKAELQRQTELTQQAEQSQQNVGQMNGQMIEAAGQMSAIKNQFDSTDWAGMETEDPGQAALYRQKLNDAYNAARQQYGASEQQQGQARQQSMQQELHKAQEQLLQDIPSWNDQEVMKVEKEGIRNTAIEYGFSDNDLSGVTDPRVVKLLRDLMNYKKSSKAATEAVRSIKKAPRVLKPGSAKVSNQSNVEALIKVSKNATTNKRQAETAALRAIFNER